MVIANGDGLNWQDVCQMVGRSSRRFGLCEGKVYVLTGLETDDNSGGKQYLKRNEFNFATDEGVYIAEALLKKMPVITSKNVRKEIVNLTFDPVDWRVTRVEFAKNNPNVLKLLREQNYKPTSQW